MSRMPNLTHKRLTELLNVDPESGEFRWKARPSNRVRVGDRAGVFHPASGGRYISIDGEKFMAHRLMWFYVHKRWPNTEARPIDGNYDHCGIENLREFSRVTLQHQRSKPRTNSSGYLGVSPARRGKWQASITWNFDSEADASAVYQEAARRLKEAKTDDDLARILDEVRLWRRQRTLWQHFERRRIQHTWPSFEAFCAEVTAFHPRRYAIVPLDVRRPLGPGNFRWALPTDAEVSTRDGIVAYNRAVRHSTRDHVRDKQLRADYGINTSEYRRLLDEQGGVCAICGKAETKFRNSQHPRSLSLDHVKGTKTVRGVLCGNCNIGLGYFGHDTNLLRRAAAYLEKYTTAVRPSTSTSATN
jgi:Recombination endonuclease VII